MLGYARISYSSQFKVGKIPACRNIDGNPGSEMVFMQPQRLVVPLFQRPYVWSEESQWEPLWDDVVRVANRRLSRPSDKHQPHFLGAVVLQQVQNPSGLMQLRTIIDGQQRLTTLQLLLDALRRIKSQEDQRHDSQALRP